MKKKILFVNTDLQIGGVERALISILNDINNDYDISLFLFKNSGGLKDELPRNVKIIEANKIARITSLSSSEAKEDGLFIFILRSILAIYCRVINNYFPISFLLLFQKRIKGFDVVISYKQNSISRKSLYSVVCNEFVLKRTIAPFKIAFLHCDFLKYGGNNKRNREQYLKFDHIITCSYGSLNSFLTAIPNIKEKTIVINNFFNYKEIINQSTINPIEYSIDNINFVSIARLSEEKGLLRVVNAIVELLKIHRNIQWHIIGDGPLKKELENKIKEFSLTNIVILHGSQLNAYRFVRNADVFILPSFHESAPLVLNESMCLNVPCISTNTLSANEFIKNNITGLVCENSEEGLYSSMQFVLNNKNEIIKWKENLKQQIFSNEKSYFQFKEIIDNEC